VCRRGLACWHAHKHFAACLKGLRLAQHSSSTAMDGAVGGFRQPAANCRSAVQYELDPPAPSSSRPSQISVSFAAILSTSAGRWLWLKTLYVARGHLPPSLVLLLLSACSQLSKRLEAESLDSCCPSSSNATASARVRLEARVLSLTHPRPCLRFQQLAAALWIVAAAVAARSSQQSTRPPSPPLLTYCLYLSGPGFPPTWSSISP
jgi:hypothetical protein